MNTKELKISEIEFDLIKQNLKNFLKSQNEFTSYNFEGSAFNILLDVLAYNTYYQAFYNNMTVNEMFLDSASKRSSIVSIAKHFAYRPRTIRSSRVIVEVSLSGGLSTDSILRGTKITASKSGESFSFTLLDDAVFNAATFDTNGQISTISTGSIEFVEGSIKKYSFMVDAGNSSQKYVIPFANVDASTLRVSIQSSSTTSQLINYTEATNITELKDDSNVYYLEENADGYLELTFGDGILGKKLSNGNIIRIEILESLGDSANGVGVANSSNTFGTSTIPYSTIRVIVPSSGGSAAETKESIRFNTTRNFVTQ